MELAFNNNNVRIVNEEVFNIDFGNEEALKELDLESERAQDEKLVGQIELDGMYVRITN